MSGKDSPMTAENQQAGFRLKIVIAPGIAIGPGKADLLQGIKETGSISAAGRRMRMSYKRAWHLVETLNGYFETPLVETVKGGRAGGGARLTALGEQVLAAFREMESLTGAAIRPVMERLPRSVRSI